MLASGISAAEKDKITDLEVNNAKESIVINNTNGVKPENINVSAKNRTFGARNSVNTTVSGKKYDKIDSKKLDGVRVRR